IFWAIALGIVVYPLHIWLLKRFNGRESLAAMVGVFAVVIVVILPLIGIGAAVTAEAAALYERLDADNGGLDQLYSRATDSMPSVVALLQRFGIDPTRLEGQLSSAAVTASQFIAQRAVSFGQNTLRITVFFFLFLYLLSFFLRVG